jgi:cholesterol transport system auxiliary component
LSVLVACALSGCSGLGSLVTKSPPPAFDLAAARDFPHHGRNLRGLLIVAEPTALSALDGDRIVVRPAPGEAAALPDAQWQDRLPKLVQARLVQSFENANLMRRVGLPADKLAGDYVLVSALRAFDLSAADQSAVVEIAVKIVGERSGRIGAAHVFRATVPAPSMEGPAAVAALNAAFAKVAKEIVLWTARTV